MLKDNIIQGLSIKLLLFTTEEDGKQSKCTLVDKEHFLTI